MKKLHLEPEDFNATPEQLASGDSLAEWINRYNFMYSRGNGAIYRAQFAEATIKRLSNVLQHILNNPKLAQDKFYRNQIIEMVDYANNESWYEHYLNDDETWMNSSSSTVILSGDEQITET